MAEYWLAGTGFPLDFSNADSRNVTSIAKNQIYPLKIELMRDPCAAAFCIEI